MGVKVSRSNPERCRGPWLYPKKARKIDHEPHLLPNQPAAWIGHAGNDRNSSMTAEYILGAGDVNPRTASIESGLVESLEQT